MITINMFGRVFLKTTSKQQSFRWQNEIPLKLVVNEKKSIKSLGLVFFSDFQLTDRQDET